MNRHFARARALPRFVFAATLLAGGFPADAVGPGPWPWVATSAPVVTLLLVGDFNVQQRSDPASAMQLVQATLQQADLVYANLEGLLVPSRGAANDLPNKTGWQHIGPEAVAALQAGNIDVVGVANNVAYGPANIMQSLAVLDRHGIAHAGGGVDLDAAHSPAIIERNGVRIGFLQYTSKWYDEGEQIATAGSPGVARLKSADGVAVDGGDLQRMQDDIKRLRPLVDVVILSTHTRDGQQRSAGAGVADAGSRQASTTDLYARLPVNPDVELIEPYQTTMTHAAIDAGADVVFGHGCHMLQKVEIYRDKPIMHCLGNFASDWIRVRNYKDGLLARVAIADGRVQRVSLVPVSREESDNNVRLLDPRTGDGAALYRKLVALSPEVELPIDGQEILLQEK